LLRGDPLGGLWYILIGWFIKDASASSYHQVRLDETLRGVTVRDAMVEERDATSVQGAMRPLTIGWWGC
jgi:hypothetical protein